MLEEDIAFFVCGNSAELSRLYEWMSCRSAIENYLGPAIAISAVIAIFALWLWSARRAAGMKKGPAKRTARRKKV